MDCSIDDKGLLFGMRTCKPPQKMWKTTNQTPRMEPTSSNSDNNNDDDDDDTDVDNTQAGEDSYGQVRPRAYAAWNQSLARIYKQ